MQSVIVWLRKEAVLALRDRQIAEHGGSTGVRDATFLESALARPQQLYAYGEPPPDLADLAATLAFGLARNHPFVDGNKRTAFVSCRTFLLLNDADLVASTEDKYVTMMALAEGQLSVEEFAAWLRTRIHSAPKDQVQEPRRRRKAQIQRRRKAAA